MNRKAPTAEQVIGELRKAKVLLCQVVLHQSSGEPLVSANRL